MNDFSDENLSDEYEEDERTRLIEEEKYISHAWKGKKNFYGADVSGVSKSAADDSNEQLEEIEALRLENEHSSRLTNYDLDPYGIISTKDKEYNQNKKVEFIQIIEPIQKCELNTKQPLKNNKSLKKEKELCEILLEKDKQKQDSLILSKNNKKKQKTSDKNKNEKFELLPTEERRPATARILKNQGLTPYRSRKSKNPRAKLRKKYRTADIKFRHEVHEFKETEMHYGGEKTGINIGIVRSTSLLN